MNFKIDKKIFERFPSLSVGVVIAKNINNAENNAEIATLQHEQIERIKNQYRLEALEQLPKIQAWREAYKSFGAKPKKYRSSVENLYRMILEGVQVRSINTIVDLYNFISLKYMAPVGGDDVDKVDGDIILQFATGNETFKRLNSDEVDHPKEGEVIYTDEKEVLCRRWNWRECEKTKMTTATKNVMLVVEGLSPVTEKDVEAIITELAELIEKYCGGEISKDSLNYVKNNKTL